MRTVLLPPGVNPIAVNKYISINQYQLVIRRETLRMRISRDYLCGGGSYAYRTMKYFVRVLAYFASLAVGYIRIHTSSWRSA